MAEFLTTKSIISKTEEIIRNAQTTLVLVSPYWQLSDNLVERISNTARRNTPVNILFGKEYNLESLGDLFAIKNTSIRYLENLHAKCYYNQDSMVIGSMNMYEFSEKNCEMGIYITRDADKLLFEAAKKEAEYFWDHVNSQNLKESSEYGNNSKMASSILKHLKKEGVCIRCGDALKHDTLKPLCTNCYNSWANWEDDEYPENYCHSCGNEADTSMAYPECRTCYKTNSKKKKAG